MASGHAYSNSALETEGLNSPWDFPQVASVNHLPESRNATVREGEDMVDQVFSASCLLDSTVCEGFTNRSYVIPENILYRWGQGTERG